jgi:DNA-binding beta-propeller fold protein YncE
MKHIRISQLALAVLLALGLILSQASGPAGAFLDSRDDEDQPFGSFQSLAGPARFWYERTFGETEVPFFADTAHIYNPEGVGLDAGGNLWVAETLGARVLKYSANGAFLDSIGEAGRVWLADNQHISVPMDVTIDGAGNVWVVDQNSKRVVKFGPTGNYLAQLGVTWEGGTDNAHFNDPWSVAFDSAGNIYVSDAGNHRIQVYDQDLDYLTTIGVTGVAGADNAHFFSPWRIAIDDDDNLYVADLLNERVQMFNSSHNYVATLGVTGVLGDDDAHFNNPRGVAVDDEWIYVADGGNHRIQIFERATRVYQATLGEGPGLDYSLNWPSDVAVDATGNIYVADLLHNRVQKYNSSLEFVRTFGTTDVPYLTDEEHFNMPVAVAVDDAGNIGLVEDEFRGHRFIKMDSDGEPLFSLGEAGVKGGGVDHFGNPSGVDFDSAGNIYVVDQWNHRVQIFDSAGGYLNTLGTGFGVGPSQFNYPSGVAVDGSGNIYVADTGNHRVQIYDSDRQYVATIGISGVTGGDNFHLDWPRDVEVDGDGNIYVADTLNRRVQVFGSNRAWKMTLGETGVWGGDGLHFSEPHSVAVDHQGKIYVADLYNNRVQVFAGNGTYLATIGGSWGDQADQFRYPTGVAVDADGNVYIADKYNHRVQKYAPGNLLFMPLAVQITP